MNTQQKIDFLLERVNQLEKDVELLKAKPSLTHHQGTIVDCVSRHHLPSEKSQIQPVGFPQPIIS